MDTMTKLLLGGGAALVIYEFFFKPSMVTTSSPGPSVGSGINPQVAQQTLNAIVTDMQVHGDNPNKLYSVYEWNFYYKRTRGVDGPGPEQLFPNVDPNKLYSLTEWWGAMNGQGFSGVGTIAHRVNPYLNPTGQPYGANIRANASERAVIRS
jgi:hypothetical protein